MADENQGGGGSMAGNALAGCGGCGCLTGLLALVAGAGMVAWGSTDSKVTELILPGYATLGGAGLFLPLGLLLLVIGLVLRSRAA